MKTINKYKFAEKYKNYTLLGKYSYIRTLQYINIKASTSLQCIDCVSSRISKNNHFSIYYELRNTVEEFFLARNIL